MKHIDYHLRRVHSLLGLFPLAFSVPLYMHMVGNEYLAGTPGSPPAVLIIIILGVPGLLHILIGLYILYQNTGSTARRRGAPVVLQRAMTFVMLSFILIHPCLIQRAIRDIRLLGPTAIVFLIGTLALAFHIGNGVYSFTMTSGWTRTAGRRRAWKCAAAVYSSAFWLYMLVLYGRVFYAMRGVLTGVI